MNGTVIIFYFLAVVAVLMAAGVVFARSPVHSAFFLVISFLNLAGLYIMLGAEFLAAVQVIIYTGAILVLFLFVIMLVRPENLAELNTTPPLQVGLSWLLGIGLFFELASVITTGIVQAQRAQYTPAQIQQMCGVSAQGQSFTLQQAQEFCGGNTQLLGAILYSNFLLPFEVASLVLLVAVIAAIVLGLPERVVLIHEGHTRTISLGHPRGTDLIEEAARAHEPAVAAPDLGEPGSEDVEAVPTAARGRTGTGIGGEEHPPDYDFRAERPKP